MQVIKTTVTFNILFKTKYFSKKTYFFSINLLNYKNHTDVPPERGVGGSQPDRACAFRLISIYGKLFLLYM